jgi:hypothetical protein
MRPLAAWEVGMTTWIFRPFDHTSDAIGMLGCRGPGGI